MPRTLHLIRHGKPSADPATPSHEWELAPGALDGLDALMSTLNPRPDVIVSSEKPKAQATAQAIAAALGIPWHPAPGLHEQLQLRYTVPFYPKHAEFAAEMRRFFAHAGGLDAHSLWQAQTLLDALSVEWPSGRPLS